jgi:hypothetical protein
MPGFYSYDDLINQITFNGNYNDYNFYKISSDPSAAGVWHCLWTSAGNPGAGGTPGTSGSGTVYNAAVGGMNFNAVSPLQRSVLSFGAVSTQNCTLMVYDRLAAISGISTSSTGSKAAVTPTFTRYSSGSGLNSNVQVWGEITTAITGTPILYLSSYTNQNGISGRVGGSITLSSLSINDAFLFPLATTDTGVQSVNSIYVSTSATGIFNVVLLRPLAYLPLLVNQWNEKDLVLQLAHLPTIYDNATLAFMFLANSTTAPQIYGRFATGYE